MYTPKRKKKNTKYKQEEKINWPKVQVYTKLADRKDSEYLNITNR